jgi:putative acetyltransferase
VSPVRHRPATLDDASRLFELRRKSIITLAPGAMPLAQAERWAASLTVAGMARKIQALEIWIAELNGRVMGWGAIRADRLEGLYIDPEFTGRGIGSDLLGFLEELMRSRGVPAVRAEASPNARQFYLRRGYESNGPPTAEGACPVLKRLS